MFLKGDPMKKKRTSRNFSLSPQEVASLLGVTRQHVYALMDRGELGSIRVGRRRLITRYDLERLLGPERVSRLLELGWNGEEPPPEKEEPPG